MERRQFKIAAVLIAGLALIALVAAFTAPSAAQEGDGFLAANGRVSFRLYCASCHGASAKGDGSVAKFLKVPPADLTLLSQKYDGELPEDKLYAIIDGREEVRAHGRREMPVWGDVFQSPLSDSEETGESGQERVDRKVRELIVFLRTIQVEQ